MTGILFLVAAFNVSRWAVLPSDTDPKIDNYDSPHSVFVDRSVTPRNELLLVLPGTNGKTRNMDAFCSTAAELGYQVINLMYPDDVPAASVSRSSDPGAFLNFRLAVIEGKDDSPAINVSRANSIENRLIKVLQRLNTLQPRLHWDQYLTSTGEPNWEHIAVSGLSQGAGHAALIAFKHHVARAVLFGGPKDYSRALRAPATWYSSSATPLNDVFTFNHEQDRQGCTPSEQVQNCKAMGLGKFGGPVEVERSSPPYGNSHMLFTNYPGASITSVQAHVSVVGDGSSPVAADGSRLFKPVWVYMLTAKGAD